MSRNNVKCEMTECKTPDYLIKTIDKNVKLCNEESVSNTFSSDKMGIPSCTSNRVEGHLKHLRKSYSFNGAEHSQQKNKTKNELLSNTKDISRYVNYNSNENDFGKFQGTKIVLPEIDYTECYLENNVDISEIEKTNTLLHNVVNNNIDLNTKLEDGYSNELNSKFSLKNKCVKNEKQETYISIEALHGEANSETAFSMESDCLLESAGNFTSNDCSGLQSVFGAIQTDTSVMSTLNQVRHHLNLVCESALSEGLSEELANYELNTPLQGNYHKQKFANSKDINDSITSLPLAVPDKIQQLIPHSNSVPSDLSLCYVSSKHFSTTFQKKKPKLPPFENNFRNTKLRTSHRLDLCTEINNLQKLSGTPKSSVGDFSTCSSSILPPISMKNARRKSYLVGRVCAFGSLLGSEELSRYFPDNKVKIFVGTWNMNCQNSPKHIDDFLLPERVDFVPDIYAIGVQEGMQDRKEWEILMQTSIGPSHVLFHSACLGVLYLAVFLRRDLTWFCSAPEDASVNTRAGSMVKTKGAVAITFTFFGTSFLFINSHLTAHEEKLKERLADYKKICNAIDLPKQLPLKSQYQSKDVTERFDYVFWCGDLNFRLLQERSTVMSFVEEKLRQITLSYDTLLQSDQLHKAMKEGIAFSGFTEGVINFGPSYKFNIGTNLFDTTKSRVPSYTDRVLYKSKQFGTADCIYYDVVPSITSSDHKPVYAVFEVILRPGSDNIPLAAGLFNRDVYLEAIHRRSKELDVTTGNRNSVVCSIM